MMNDLSDLDLIALVRAGNRDAYGELYVRHHPIALRLARGLARCRDDADDFVAEAFTSTLRLLDKQLGPSDAFRAYLLTAVRNAAYTRTRHERRIKLSQDDVDLDVSVPFVDRLSEEAGLSQLIAAIDRLPVRWQNVLRLTGIDELSRDEVALRLGMTPSGVTALKHRAREGLRRILAHSQGALVEPLPSAA